MSGPEALLGLLFIGVIIFIVNLFREERRRRQWKEQQDAEVKQRMETDPIYKDWIERHQKK